MAVYLVDVISTTEELTALTSAVEAAALHDALKASGPYTLFAPTNQAFHAIPPGVMDTLVNTPELLRKVLMYHVVQGRWSTDDLCDVTYLTTLEGEGVTITLDLTGDLHLNIAAIVTPNIVTDNGIIHTIDHVIIPPAVIARLRRAA